MCETMRSRLRTDCCTRLERRVTVTASGVCVSSKACKERWSTSKSCGVPVFVYSQHWPGLVAPRSDVFWPGQVWQAHIFAWMLLDGSPLLQLPASRQCSVDSLNAFEGMVQSCLLCSNETAKLQPTWSDNHTSRSPKGGRSRSRSRSRFKCHASWSTHGPTRDCHTGSCCCRHELQSLPCHMCLTCCTYHTAHQELTKRS
jgi:hypothetical protein